MAVTDDEVRQAMSDCLPSRSMAASQRFTTDRTTCAKTATMRAFKGGFIGCFGVGCAILVVLFLIFIGGPFILGLLGIGKSG
jgi:hypothetical protein